MHLNENTYFWFGCEFFFSMFGKDKSIKNYCRTPKTPLHGNLPTPQPQP